MTIETYKFEVLSECPKLVHGVFLRQGGVSREARGSLNFGLVKGESLENIRLNKRRALAALGLTRAWEPRQQHGREVVDVTTLERGKPACDALMSNRPGEGLLIKHADCQAALFYDPIHHALANVHCGWRGSVQNIYQKTVEAMGLQYGTRPEDLLVGISPSLGPQAAEFRNYERELPRSFWEFQVKPTYFDFWEISHQQLLNCGVLSHHIEIARICTYSHPESYFSHRREKDSGRHATIAALL